MKNTLSHGEEFAVDGLTFVVTFEDDTDADAPWDNSDGHGPVSEWVRRDKAPGERVLVSDNRGRYGSRRFYDFAEATRIAKRDGWGVSDESRAALEKKLGRAPTAGEVTAQAVENDFEFLRRWCNDEWHYVGVCVRHLSQDDDARYSYAIWGIESDAHDYLTEVAHELASQCASSIRADIASEREALKTNRHQFSALAMDLRNSAKLAPAICDAVKSKLQSLMADRSRSMVRISELTV